MLLCSVKVARQDMLYYTLQPFGTWWAVVICDCMLEASLMPNNAASYLAVVIESLLISFQIKWLTMYFVPDDVALQLYDV